MQEKDNRHQQKMNVTLARFYEWVKHCEQRASLKRLYSHPMSNVEKIKNDIASPTL